MDMDTDRDTDREMGTDTAGNRETVSKVLKIATMSHKKFANF
jgi:hypothetical protein